MITPLPNGELRDERDMSIEFVYDGTKFFTPFENIEEFDKEKRPHFLSFKKQCSMAVMEAMFISRSNDVAKVSFVIGIRMAASLVMSRNRYFQARFDINPLQAFYFEVVGAELQEGDTIILTGILREPVV